MVLNASLAANRTLEAINKSNAEKLQYEVTQCESVILTAASKGLYSTAYDAKQIGNPLGNPMLDANVPGVLQKQFRDRFVAAGYTVGLDSISGRWKLTWEPVA